MLATIPIAITATPFVAIFTIFVLAIFVGYYVVWGVTLPYAAYGGDQRPVEYCNCWGDATNRAY